MSIFYTLSLIISLLPAQLLAAPLTAANNKTKPLDGRIVGGVEATIQQFPHQVSLQRSGQHICGAIVIHSQVLLSAAHCFSEVKPETYQVRAGSTDLYKGGNLINVRRIILHEDYNTPTKLSNDIALIILEEPLIFSRYIRAIPLMTEKDVLLPRSNLYVSGWGSTSANSLQVSQRLRYTALHEIDHSKCAASYKGATQVTTKMMCAGVELGGRDSCQGDSGGPLIAFINGSIKLIGIVSWGISCAHPSYPGVYTKVVDYNDWIREHMNNAGGFQL